jgi:hypothetical protein
MRSDTYSTTAANTDLFLVSPTNDLANTEIIT